MKLNGPSLTSGTKNATWPDSLSSRWFNATSNNQTTSVCNQKSPLRLPTAKVWSLTCNKRETRSLISRGSWTTAPMKPWKLWARPIDRTFSFLTWKIRLSHSKAKRETSRIRLLTFLRTYKLSKPSAVTWHNRMSVCAVLWRTWTQPKKSCSSVFKRPWLRSGEPMGTKLFFKTIFRHSRGNFFSKTKWSTTSSSRSPSWTRTSTICNLNSMAKPRSSKLSANSLKSKPSTSATFNIRCLSPSAKKTIFTVSCSSVKVKSSTWGLSCNLKKSKLLLKQSWPSSKPRKSLS